MRCISDMDRLAVQLFSNCTQRLVLHSTVSQDIAIVDPLNFAAGLTLVPNAIASHHGMIYYFVSKTIFVEAVLQGHALNG